MKGKISLGDFIREVKQELVQATKDGSGDPFFALSDVELEASFSLEAEGEVGMKFIVEAKGTATASQVHKVTLKFKTLAPDSNEFTVVSGVDCEFPSSPVLRGARKIGPVPMNIDPTLGTIDEPSLPGDRLPRKG